MPKMLPALPNNRLILNGHKILNQDQLFASISKRLKTTVLDRQELRKLLSSYQGLHIAIWHGDSFLEEENEATQKEIVLLLSELGTLKISGKKKR